MDREGFKQLVQQIGLTEDDAQRRALLAQLSDDTISIFDENSALTAQKEQLQSDNEALRAANMSLFIRVGGDPQPDPEPDPEPVPERRKFEDLFDEKGRLK